MKIEINEFNKIELDGYKGYYWFSNADKPIVDDFSEIEKKLNDEKLPFVTEAFLYNENEKISISIKNFNGKHHINKFNIVELEEENSFKLLKERTVPANSKLKDVNSLKLRMLQEMQTEDELSFWKDVCDIFTGFEYKTNSKK